MYGQGFSYKASRKRRVLVEHLIFLLHGTAIALPRFEPRFPSKERFLSFLATEVVCTNNPAIRADD